MPNLLGGLKSAHPFAKVDPAVVAVAESFSSQAESECEIVASSTRDDGSVERLRTARTLFFFCHFVVRAGGTTSEMDFHRQRHNRSR